jgi:hypothetical protein
VSAAVLSEAAARADQLRAGKASSAVIVQCQPLNRKVAKHCWLHCFPTAAHLSVTVSQPARCGHVTGLRVRQR